MSDLNLDLESKSEPQPKPNSKKDLIKWIKEYCKNGGGSRRTKHLGCHACEGHVESVPGNENV